MKKCEFSFEIPDYDICCAAHAHSKRKDGLHWSHYPTCTDENCPIIHKELLEGAVLTETEMKVQVIDKQFIAIVEYRDKGKCVITSKNLNKVISDWSGPCKYIPDNDAEVYLAIANGEIINSFKIRNFGSLMRYLINMANEK